MLTDSEDAFIKEYAYVPEHITGYVTAVSGSEPFLINDYICYVTKPHLPASGEGSLVFVGYPLIRLYEEDEMRGVLDSAIERFKPSYVSVIAPSISVPADICENRASDRYYKLDISGLQLSQKLRNMINCASRQLCTEKKQGITDEHKALISEFLSYHAVDDGTRRIFERIPQYISSVPTACVFDARDRAGRLAAFDIAEFGTGTYAFYMFNFASRRHSVRGASDLLLNEVIAAAKAEGKTSINLGLGVNEGVMFFKKKWGGIPFINYEFCLYRENRTGLLTSLLKRFQ